MATVVALRIEALSGLMQMMFVIIALALLILSWNPERWEASTRWARAHALLVAGLLLAACGVIQAGVNADRVPRLIRTDIPPVPVTAWYLSAVGLLAARRVGRDRKVVADGEVSTATDQMPEATPKRRADIVDLALNGPESLHGMGVENDVTPPVFIGRYLHLVNMGEDTTLRDWRAEIQLPGGHDYRGALLPNDERWRVIKAEMMSVEHAGLPVLSGTEVRAPPKKSIELCVVFLVSGLAPIDVPLNTRVAITCTDTFGEEWEFSGRMHSRLGPPTIIPVPVEEPDLRATVREWWEVCAEGPSDQVCRLLEDAIAKEVVPSNAVRGLINNHIRQPVRKLTYDAVPSYVKSDRRDLDRELLEQWARSYRAALEAIKTFAAPSAKFDPERHGSLMAWEKGQERLRDETRQFFKGDAYDGMEDLLRGALAPTPDFIRSSFPGKA